MWTGLLCAFGERQQFALLWFSDVGKGDSMGRLSPESVDDLVVAAGNLRSADKS